MYYYIIAKISQSLPKRVLYWEVRAARSFKIVGKEKTRAEALAKVEAVGGTYIQYTS